MEDFCNFPVITRCVDVVGACNSYFCVFYTFQNVRHMCWHFLPSQSSKSPVLIHSRAAANTSWVLYINRNLNAQYTLGLFGGRPSIAKNCPVLCTNYKSVYRSPYLPVIKTFTNYNTRLLVAKLHGYLWLYTKNKWN